MPWGEGPGWLPPLRAVDGAELVRLVAETRVHELVAADEVDEGPARECWREFADLMRDVVDGLPDGEDRAALPRTCDAAIADLRAFGVRVVAGAAGGILHVAVLPQGWRRDPHYLFARG
jgi:hypothetical protein